MRKILAVLLAALLIFSASVTVYAKPNKSKHELKIRTETRLESKGEKENRVQNKQQTKFGANAGIKTFKGKVRINGREIKFDIPPVIKDGRTLIPVRAVMNGLGAKVEWDPETKTVTVTKGDTVIQFILGENRVLVNGKEMTLDVPAMEISNRTFVPLRFLSEVLKENVKYDDKTGDIEIEEKTGTATENTEESTVSQNVYGNTNETVSSSVYNSNR